MTNVHLGNVPAVTHEHRWPTALAALAVGTAFFLLWFWLLPQWLGFRIAMAGAEPWRWLAALPSVMGFSVALRCVWDFGWKGRGTPAPIAPPKRLVVVGFYRHVLDWTVGCLRTRHSIRDHCRHSGCSRGTPVRHSL